MRVRLRPSDKNPWVNIGPWAMVSLIPIRTVLKKDRKQPGENPDKSGKIFETARSNFRTEILSQDLARYRLCATLWLDQKW